MSTRYDAIILGTGQAGPHLADRLIGAGQKVAIVERKLFGGTCVNTGCIPTKTMIASATMPLNTLLDFHMRSTDQPYALRMAVF